MSDDTELSLTNDKERYANQDEEENEIMKDPEFVSQKDLEQIRKLRQNVLLAKSVFENHQLVEKNAILQIYIKYGLKMDDQINDETGEIQRL